MAYNKSRHIAWVFLTLLLSAASLRAGQTFQDKTLGVVLEIPDGFVSVPYQAKGSSGVRHTFIKGDPTDKIFDTTIFLRPVNGPIRPQPFPPSDLPSNFPGRVTQRKWKGLDVLVVIMPEKASDGTPTLTYTAEIPLKGDGMLLQVVGPASSDMELDALLKQLLGSLEAKTPEETGISRLSCWLTGAWTWICINSRWLAGVAFLVVAVVGNAIVRKQRQKKAYKRQAANFKTNDPRFDDMYIPKKTDDAPPVIPLSYDTDNDSPATPK